MTSDTDFVQQYCDFLDASPTSYHAAANVLAALVSEEFEAVDEKSEWTDLPRHGVTVRDGAVIAWRIPESFSADAAIRVVGAHTDSPAFKLKPNPSFNRVGWQQAGMEVYGGPLLNSWLDRELGLAGRLVTVDGRVVLVKTGPWLRIPQLAPHLDRSVNETLHLDKQAHLAPVYSVGRPDLNIVALLCDQADVDPAELAFYDIHAFPTEPAGRLGVAGEFVASARMDNLSSVFAGLQALRASSDGPDAMVFVCNDHEEVGSATRSGAEGPFLESILDRIGQLSDITGDARHALLARSTCISADAGHGVHPNYATMHDPENLPLLGSGPLLKINANQRYATDGVGGAMFMRACRAANVGFQPFVSNNSVPCGTTIGPLTATRLGLTTVDVGIPLLSMHSAREMCASIDVAALSAALAAYWAGA